MRADDFFVDDAPPWAAGSSARRLNTELLVALRRGPVPGHDDVEVAVGLARLVHDDLEQFGTGGGEELTGPQIRDALLALTAVVRRLNITDFELPFRDFSTFKGHWLRNDGYGSYQARRDLLSELFEPLHDRLIELETHSLNSGLARAVSPHPVTGWARVDEELAELRRHFEVARTEQDHRNIGNDCVTVLEALSAIVYDPAKHLRAGEDEPPVAKTKQRIERFVEEGLGGPEHVELRRMVRGVIEFAQAVKHRPQSTRRDAGIAADGVILLANILRRLADPPR